MITACHRSHLVLPSLFALILSPTARAADVASQVAQMLDTGWKASSANYATSEQQYQQAKAVAPTDIRIPFAMALVAVQNHKRLDAAKYLEAALTSGKALLPVRRTKLWLDVLRKDRAAAQIGIRDLARTLAADPAQAEKLEYQDTARWLGAVVGYYGGPGQAELATEELSVLEAEINSMLTGTLGTAFAAGKSSVAERAQQLTEQLETARNEAAERNEAKLAQNQQKQEAALAQTREKQAKTAERAQQMQEKQKEETPEKAAQLQRAQQELQMLDANLGGMKQQLEMERAKPANQQRRTWMSQIEQRIRVEETKMSAAKKALQTRITTLQNELNVEQGNINAAEKDLERQKRIERIQARQAKQLDKPASQDDAVTAALATKLKSISTYAGVDLDQEKQRILDSYRPK